MKIEIITGAADTPVTKFFSSPSTPHYVSVLDVEEWATKCINLERERDEAREESLQQARLLGMSGERECKLIAERDEALQQEKIHYDNLAEMKQKFDHEAIENMLSTNKICNERDEAMDVLSNLSHYLSCGLGDENTTAKEYGARIREGINALTDPIIEEKEKLRKMLDLQTMIEVDLRMKSME